jgi:hypothetical protein
VGPSEGD